MTSNVITGPAERGVLQAGIAAGVQGSRQGTYTIYWKKLDGTAMVLTGAVLTGYIQNVEGGDVRAMDGALTVTGAATGVFTWEPGADDVAEAGGFEVQFKAVIGGGTAYSYPVPWVVKKNLPAAGLVGGSTLLVGVTQAQANLLDAFLTAAEAAANGQVFVFDGDGSGAEGDAAGGGVSDHGALTGLADDDHTQYHNDTRGDVRYTQRFNNLSDVADAATARGNLLAQLASVLLSAIAALTGVANGIIRFTGAAAVEVVALASHIWTFLESADAAAARAAIGAGAGNGDVTGPASSTDNQIARFDLTTGKIIQGGTGAPTYDDAGRISSVDMTLSETPGSLAASPTLAFGDGDTGFYESADDALRVSIAGANKFFFLLVDGVYVFGSVNNSGAMVVDRVPTITTPAFAFRSDYGTGLGYAGAGKPVLVSNSLPAFMPVRLTGIVGSAQSVIANGTGDVTLVLSGTFTVSDGAGNVAGGVITATAPSGSFNLYDDGGTNTCVLAVAADGSVTVQRTAGSRTYACNLNLNWM